MVAHRQIHAGTPNTNVVVPASIIIMLEDFMHASVANGNMFIRHMDSV